MAGSFFGNLFRSGGSARLDARIEQAHDLTGAGRDAEARSLCDQLLAGQPAHPRLLHLKGVLLLRSGAAAAAKESILRAIAADPQSAIFHFNLGNAHAVDANHDAAAAAYREAVRLQPGHLPSLFNLGKALLEIKRHDEAIAIFTRLNTMQPDDAAIGVELGRAHYAKAGATQQLSDYDRAIFVLTPLSSRSGLTAELRINVQLFLGDALHNRRQHSAALAQFHQVLLAEPDNIDALIKTANCLSQLGRMPEALPYFERIAALQPHHLAALSSIISSADYLPQADPASNTQRRFALARRLATPRRRRAWPNTRAPQRRLRIGYVSPNLRTHVAMYLFEAVLRLHDQHRFEWFVYDATPDRDQKSLVLRTLAANWREIDAQPLDQLPAMIEADQIDILVDLAGHTSNNRLMAFACSPAPVQVSWLAYPGSTGMTEIGYLISDPHTTPPQLAHHASETVWRLPDTRFSYQPPQDCPAPALPVAGHRLTFACFNNIAKLNPVVFGLWQRILDALPAARLLIKSSALDDAGGREWLSAQLAAAGISAPRVQLHGVTAYIENFASYNQVHIALDPFPFCGGLTSLDALWMGVPVVTLEQELMAGRQTLAFLHNIGHPELIAASADEYVRIAVDLAGDVPRIERYRFGLREAMRASPLLDHTALTRNLEAAYRQMWQRYCDQPQ